MKPLILAVSVVLSATTISFAQSLPNYGPNAPPNADSFGQPPSGAMPPGVLATVTTARIHITGTRTTTDIGIGVIGIGDQSTVRQ